jgi:hypothetical protein
MANTVMREVAAVFVPWAITAAFGAVTDVRNNFLVAWWFDQSFIMAYR